MAQFPSTTAADGIWTLKKVRRAILGDNWPAPVPYDITEISYVQSFSLPSPIANVTGVSFKPDGTKLYTVDNGTDDIYDFDLSTSWDISTATYADNQGGLGTTELQDLFWKPDGTSFFVVDPADDTINKFNLSTPWDISTETASVEFDISTYAPGASSVSFKPDGTKMYALCQVNDQVVEYTLSSAWTSGLSYSHTFSVSSQTGNPQGLFFNPNGLTLFVSDTGGNIHEYALSTAWDLSTASFTQTVNLASTDARGLYFKNDGLRLYIANQDTDAIDEYTIGY